MTIIHNKGMQIAIGTQIKLKDDYPDAPVHIVNGCHVIGENLYIDFVDGHSIVEKQLKNLVVEVTEAT